MIRSRLLLAVVVSACAVTLAGCGKGQSPPPEQGNQYVGLGDSFTAVAGTGPFTDEVCRRSTDDYPGLVAKELGFERFENVSCGGAQTADLTQTQLIESTGTNQAQLSAISADTQLVTIGMGLNDGPPSTQGIQISFLLLYTCLPDEDGKRPDTCTTYLQQPESGFDSVVDDMADNVENGLEAIRERAPKARIVVVGYPRVAPDSGECPKEIPLPPVALNRLRTVIHAADKALARVAKKEGADYIDMWAASKGHDACSEDPWVKGAGDRKGKAYEFHPYKAYHRAVADKIVALLKKK